MENSLGVGFMAVFAVTGSVVILAHQIHKRLLSDFMKDIEFQFKGEFLHSHHRSRLRDIGSVVVKRRKKTVRFAEDVVEPSSNNKEYRKRHSERHHANSVTNSNSHKKPHKYINNNNIINTMPLNRQALYRGIIIESNSLKSQYNICS